MDKRISELFDYGDGIVVAPREGECDPAEIRELTMKRIHDKTKEPVTYLRAVSKTRNARRTALIAAIAAVLLIGTAFAVYQYTLKDAAIEDVPTRDSEMYDWKAGETETRLSLNGFADSPEYQAYVEWDEWNRAWNAKHPDPWGEIGEDDSYHETPNNYLTYDAWFAEQGEALDAIAAKYGLALLSEHHFIRSEAQLCRALGIENVIADGYRVGDGYFFDNGTFKASGDTAVNGKNVWFTVWNSVYGSFVPLSGVIPEEHTEWSYTTKDGFDVILMTDTLRGHTTLIAPLSGSFVTASLQTDDAQAAEDFADAVDLAALDALFATDGARAAAKNSIAFYVENLSSATTVDEIGDGEQAVLDYLGDWYPAVMPEGCNLYTMSVEQPDHFEDFYRVSRSYDGGGVYASLFYRELDPLDGENDAARQELATYSIYYSDPAASDPELFGPSAWVSTPCTVNGYEAILAEPNGKGFGDYILCWVDTDRQLFFRLSMSGEASEESVMTAAESIAGTASETPPVRTASTPEERFRFSLMPLSRVSIAADSYATDQDVATKRALAALGNYGLTELPDGVDTPTVDGWRQYMYEYYWDGRADWYEVWKTYRSDPMRGINGLTLNYKRFADGRTAEAYEAEKRYDDFYGDVTDCKIGPYDGYIAGGDFFGGTTFAAWYDSDHDLIFHVSLSSLVYDLPDEELLAMAESVTESPWTGEETGVCKLPDAERVLTELGLYTLPGTEYGSVVFAADAHARNWSEAPFWYVEDAPYESESAVATYADGLMLTWQRTWADAARTAENGAESFAAITKYLLACDDSGAVQTGLSVNGQDAICVSYPYEELWGEAHTDLLWYDADAGLIFILSDYPEEGGTPRTEAQLIALAESVAAQ